MVDLPTQKEMDELFAADKVYPVVDINNTRESAQQTALIAWARLNLCRFPCLQWLHHIPNGGPRGGDMVSREIAGARLKAQGVVPGIADIFLPARTWNFSGLYIEMKNPNVRGRKDGGITEKQKAFSKYVSAEGYAWVCAYNWKEAAVYIERYLENRLDLSEKIC